MSLDCQKVEEELFQLVQGCRSWVDLRLPPEVQGHLSGCTACRELALESVEVERRLLSLAQEDLPELDLTAAIMARLPQAVEQEVAVAPPFPWLAWCPLLLILAWFLPEPAGLPDWLGPWRSLLGTIWSLPQWSVPIPAGWVDAIAGGVAALVVLMTWRWRPQAHART